MGALYLDELKAAKNFSTFDDLSNDASESSNMKNLLDNFVSESHGHLKGEVWNRVGSELSQFSRALSARMELANRLSEAIQKALDILLNYMGDEYESLDFSQLPELEANRQRCENQIASIRATIASMSKKDDDGNSKITNDVGYYNGMLSEYQNNLFEINKLIDKLNGLKEKYIEAEKILADAFSQINVVGNDFKNIKVGKTVSFIS